MLVYVKRTLAVLLIIAILLSGMQCFNRVLHYYTSDWYHPELLPKNSVDVAFVGSSHIYCSIIPQLLMDEYGFAAANIVSAGLAGSSTVEMLDIMLQYQRPQVIVLDLFGFLAPYLYEEDMRGDGRDEKRPVDYVVRQRHVTTSPITAFRKYPWIIKGAMKDPNILAYSSFIYLQHDNILTSDWRNLTGKSLLEKEIDFAHEFAFDANFRLGVDFSEEELEQAHVYEPNWGRLDAVLALAEKEGLEIIYTFFPYKTNNAERKLMDEIEAYLKERGANFVPMTEIFDGAALDEYQDFLNRGHTNYYGATKLSWFWGDYLYANYDLPDRSQDDDPRYDPWKRRPYAYLGDEAVGQLPLEGDYQYYVEYLSQANEKYLSVVVISGSEDFADVESCTWPLVDYLGADPEGLAQEGAVTVLVLEGNQLLRQETFTEAGVLNMYLWDSSYEINVDPEDETIVRINHVEECRLSQSGVMFLVTYSLQEKQMDNATFVFEEEDPIRLNFDYGEE